MNLLAETAGLAHTFRILAVFDKHFQRQWRVRNVKVIVGEDFETVRHPHHGSGHEEYDEKLKEGIKQLRTCEQAVFHYLHMQTRVTRSSAPFGCCGTTPASRRTWRVPTDAAFSNTPWTSRPVWRHRSNPSSTTTSQSWLHSQLATKTRKFPLPPRPYWRPERASHFTEDQRGPQRTLNGTKSNLLTNTPPGW